MVHLGPGGARGGLREDLAGLPRQAAAGAATARKHVSSGALAIINKIKVSAKKGLLMLTLPSLEAIGQIFHKNCASYAAN